MRIFTRNALQLLFCALLTFFITIAPAKAQESEAKELAAKVERARQASEAAEREASAKSADAKIVEDKLVPLKATATDLQQKGATAAKNEKKAEEKATITAANLAQEQKAEQELRTLAEQAVAGTPDALK